MFIYDCLSSCGVRLPQTQPQSGRQRDRTFSSLPGAGAEHLQRPLQHPEREAGAARHQGQIQGPDWRGGGEHSCQSTLSQQLKSKAASPFEIIRFPRRCRRASATRTSGRGVWKTLWRLVLSVCSTPTAASLWSESPTKKNIGHLFILVFWSGKNVTKSVKKKKCIRFFPQCSSSHFITEQNTVTHFQL